MYDPTLLENIFSRWGIPLRGSHFLVAFSGGLDSTVLAESLVRLADRHGLVLTLGHVNHGLRPDADRDETFCREFAHRRGLPLRVAKLDPIRRRDESVEAWARRERYAALEHMRLESGAGWILTAHQADDQVETILMRLVQQAPFLSLAGIRPRRGKLLRPLLSVARKELRSWAERERLTWVEDPSNADRRFLRNQIRHGLARSIVAEVPGARDSLLGMAQLAQEYEARCAAAARELAGLAAEGVLPGTVEIPTDPLLAAEDDIFKLTIRSVVGRFLGYPPQLSSPHWQNLRHFVRVGAVGKVFELTHSVRVLMDRGRLIFFHAGQTTAPERCALMPGKTPWGFHEFLATPNGPPQEGTGMWLRSWRPGDRVRLSPSGKPRLVSDIYINARLSRLEKIHWPLVVTERDRIIWLPGLSRPRNHLEKDKWSIAWQTQIRRN